MRRRWLRIGFALGYVLGTKAGRERYEDLRRGFLRLRMSPPARALENEIRSRLRWSAGVSSSDGNSAYVAERFVRTPLP